MCGPRANSISPRPPILTGSYSSTSNPLRPFTVAFLGFSVGFSDKLSQIARFPSAPYLLEAVWGLLVISIVLVLLVSVGLHRYRVILAKASGEVLEVRRETCKSCGDDTSN
jgi:hypothetical protein